MFRNFWNIVIKNSNKFIILWSVQCQEYEFMVKPTCLQIILIVKNLWKGNCIVDCSCLIGNLMKLFLAQQCQRTVTGTTPCSWKVPQLWKAADYMGKWQVLIFHCPFLAAVFFFSMYVLKQFVLCIHMEIWLNDHCKCKILTVSNLNMHNVSTIVWGENFMAVVCVPFL